MNRRAFWRIWFGMLPRLHSLIVVITIALGLMALGLGMPAMAAPGANATTSDCRMMQSQCPGSGMDHHAGAQTCQLPCVAPVALPRPSLGAVPVIWTEHKFAATSGGLPPGLSPAPDPFPPRSVVIA